MRHETAILNNKKPNPEVPVIFFIAFVLFFHNKNTNICWNPICYSVLANAKKSKIKLTTEKFEKKKTLTRKSIFRKLPGNWAQKHTKNDNWVCNKSLETTVKIG